MDLLPGWPAPARYAAALGLTAVAVLARVLVDPLLGSELALVTTYGSVAATAWLAGTGPALLAVAAGYVACAWLFIEPRGALVLDPAHLAGLVVYVASCAVVVALGHVANVARRRQRELAASEEKLRAAMLQVELAQQAGSVGFFEYDFVADRGTWTPALARLYGLPPDAFDGSWARWARHVEPEDIAATQRTFAEAIRDRRDEVSFEYRAVLPDGTRRWLLSRSRLRYDADGRPLDAVGVNMDVSDRRQAEEALRQREAELHAVVDDLAEGLVVAAPDGRIRYWNRAAVKVTGLPPFGERSRTYAEIASMFELFAPDGERVAAEAWPMARLLRGEPVRALELRVRRRDGRVDAIVEFNGTLLRDARGEPTLGVLTFADVTERRRAEQALRESEAQLRGVFEHAGIGFAQADPYTQRLTLVNPKFCDLLGYDGASLAGRSFVDLTHPDDVAATLERYDALLRGEVDSYRLEKRYLRADGDVAWFEVSATMLRNGDGRPLRLQIAVVDVGARRRATEALRESDRRKDEFLAVLAHELRNPLAPIRNAVSIMRMAGADAADRESAREIIDRQVRQMTHLVDDLLDVSRISRGKIELRRERVPLERIVNDAVDSIRPLVDARSHALTVDLPQPPVVVDADPTRITQVVANLLNNAAKFTPPGGRIALSVEREGDAAVLRVRDDGIGIAADDIPRVFEMFAQASAPTDHGGGLGIGLALVRGLVELHGGRVTATSGGPGQGSEFVVRLPVVTLSTSAGSPTGDAADAPSARRCRVLVADDNRDAADSLARMLSMMGHEVQLAYDGLSAFDLASSMRPEIAILDIGMPGMDGYALARRLRDEAWGRSLTLVALSGWGQEDDKRRATSAGFDHHYTKPIDPSALAGVLHACGKARSDGDHPDGH